MLSPYHYNRNCIHSNDYYRYSNDIGGHWNRFCVFGTRPKYCIVALIDIYLCFNKICCTSFFKQITSIHTYKQTSGKRYVLFYSYYIIDNWYSYDLDNNNHELFIFYKHILPIDNLETLRLYDFVSMMMDYLSMFFDERLYPGEGPREP